MRAAQTLGLTMASPTSAGMRAYAWAGWNLVARASRLQSGTSVWAGDQASTEGHCRVPASLPHSINTAKGLSTNLLQSMPYNQWSDTNWAAFIIREEPHNSNTPSAHRKVLSANPTVNAAQESHTTWGSALKKMHFAVQLDQTTALFQDDTVLIIVLASRLSLIPQPFFMSLYPPRGGPVCLTGC